MWTENARGLESCYFQIAILLCLSLHFHFADSALHLPSFLDPFRSNSKRRPVASSLDIALQVQSLCFVRFDFYEALTPARQECTFKPVMFDKAIMASLQFPSSFPLTSFFCPSLRFFYRNSKPSTSGGSQPVGFQQVVNRIRRLVSILRHT